MTVVNRAIAKISYQIILHKDYKYSIALMGFS